MATCKRGTLPARPRCFYAVPTRGNSDYIYTLFRSERHRALSLYFLGRFQYGDLQAGHTPGSPTVLLRGSHSWEQRLHLYPFPIGTSPCFELVFSRTVPIWRLASGAHSRLAHGAFTRFPLVGTAITFIPFSDRNVTVL